MRSAISTDTGTGGSSLTSNGKVNPGQNYPKLTIKGNEYTWSPGGGGTFKIDPTKKLKEIDVTYTEGPEKGTTMLGIYEIDDDTYRPCFKMMGKERPTEFTADAESGQAIITIALSQASGVETGLARRGQIHAAMEKSLRFILAAQDALFGGRIRHC